MSEPVHILATCRKPELTNAATLVFRTLRTGFPSAPVTVHLNGEVENKGAIVDAAMKADATVLEHPPTIHHEWIKERLEQAKGPFWICDTDIVFWKSVEEWNPAGPLCGAATPEFKDDWSRCVTMPRLHTSLLRFDPDKLHDKLTALRDKVRVTRFTPLADLISPLVLPAGVFYDTCALLYEAVGGTPFTEAQLECYEHLNGATWVDELSESYPGLDKMHAEVYADVNKSRGSHRMMDKFYRRRGNTIEETCAELCLGNLQAAQFCHFWFNYCHAIDDLVDATDRPPHEMLLEVFALANAVYSCQFYREHSTMLQPIVLMITSAYADSVKWEGSSVHRRSTISDVLRCCGNEMFFAVAYICGGWKHVRSISSRIRERSWELQHDSNDRPE